MLDPPDDFDDEPLDSDDDVDYPDDEGYDIDECSANASSDWQGDRF
ncbi:hypothetical protein ISREJYDI_CDS0020 [Pseudomonas phage UNO-G1W1]|uniref:Uncharacterized protein n=1 Tax=Pseudomonas phage UNO-G1W1 TaxID=3136609 RepID=A0AAX4MW25_9CAUD